METKEQGQEVNADFKGNRGLNPNSQEVLEDDLIEAGSTGEDDGMIVKSTDPDSKEWGAREDVKKSH